jgi:HSP20 family protein
MPWDPVQDLLGMQERLETLFGRTTPGWVPPVDLVELGSEYRITIELPGLERADVQLEVHDGELTVKGRRAAGACPDRYLQFERAQGPFARAFKFGHPIESDRITADLAEGVLTIVVPKTAQNAARQIAVE